MANNEGYVLITGATSGIGYELAKLFAQDGYNLVIVARTQEDLETTAAQLRQMGAQVVTLSKDLFKPEAPFEVYDEVTAQGIEVSILVNDAGQGLYGEFLDTDIRRELDIIQLNVCSLVVLTKLFVKDMVTRGQGKVLNLSSIASKMPGPWQSVYHGTKAFVQSFSEAVNSELKDTGVSITALLPGVTDTDFFNKAEMNESKIVHEQKMSDPADVARDGYNALMKGDDMVISGMKNKMQVAMSNITPDAKSADMMKKQQEPVSGEDRK